MHVHVQGGQKRAQDPLEPQLEVYKLTSVGAGNPTMQGQQALLTFWPFLQL